VGNRRCHHAHSAGRHSIPREHHSIPRDQHCILCEQHRTPRDQHSTPCDQRSTPHDQHRTPCGQHNLSCEQHSTSYGQYSIAQWRHSTTDERHGTAQWRDSSPQGCVARRRCCVAISQCSDATPPVCGARRLILRCRPVVCDRRGPAGTSLSNAPRRHSPRPGSPCSTPSAKASAAAGPWCPARSCTSCLSRRPAHRPRQHRRTSTKSGCSTP